MINLVNFVYIGTLRVYCKECPQLVGLKLVGVSILHRRYFAHGSYLLGDLTGVRCPFQVLLNQNMRTCLQGKLWQMLCKIHRTLCWSVGIRYPSLNENAMWYTVIAWIIESLYVHTNTKMVVEFFADCVRPVQVKWDIGFVSNFSFVKRELRHMYWVEVIEPISFQTVWSSIPPL